MSSPPATADEVASLVGAAQAGDRRALDKLLRDQQPYSHALCRRLTGNDADALDATQEAMIAVVRGLPRFDGRARFSTWVYRVTTNACLDELRRRQRRPVVALTDRDGTSIDVADERGPTLADSVSDRMFLDAALNELEERFRVAVVLRDVCGLEYAEIAAILAVPTGTVRSRIARGRAHLAEKLARSGNRNGPSERPNEQP